MNCFNHDAIAAVGICKHCNKALCHDCLTDTTNGLACTATCVESVNTLNYLIDRSRKTATAQRGNAYLTSILLGVMGVIFLAFGVQGGRNASLPLAMGIGMVGLSIVYAFRMRKWIKSLGHEPDPDT